MKDLSKKAKEIIEKIEYITIASITPKGKPWNSPVFGAYDKDFNFYFGTHRGSQKSKNLSANNHIFIVIYDSTVEAGAGEGVYIQAKVTELTDSEEIKTAHKLLWDRHSVPYWKPEEFKSGSPLVLYKAKTEKVWMNDESETDGHYIDTRTEIKL
jgi:nitroimidazol reductase NimA-like FMN-containing flavoprotein (pyridoxamine 5'-phosphate oxidase superfamily)